MSKRFADETQARYYALDRDRAFIAFVEDGNFEHIDRLMDKYHLQRIPHTDTGAASVYKAVQECDRIGSGVKARAFCKAVELGYSPFIGPVAKGGA